jgi:hypothetical protein
MVTRFQIITILNDNQGNTQEVKKNAINNFLVSINTPEEEKQKILDDLGSYAEF